MDLSTPYWCVLRAYSEPADRCSYLQFHSLAYLVKLHIEVVMTELIIKIVRYSNSNNGTELTDTNAEYIPDTAVRRSRRPDFSLASGDSIRATYNASVSVENGQWLFPGIEKTVRCEVEAEESEATTSIEPDAHKRTLEA
jgi:hypothetical protein